jgi:hypothetical protein
MARNEDRSSLSQDETVEVKRRLFIHRVPIVKISRPKKKKKSRGRRRRYTENSLLLPLGVIEHRVLNGLARMGSEYRHRSDKSGRKRRDGALRDFAKNASRSSEEFFSQAANIPADILEKKPFKNGWDSIRRAGKIFSFRF